ncbi:uncharacterized protein LOC144128249 isoform X2 [Amblyomma americanum]
MGDEKETPAAAMRRYRQEKINSSDPEVVAWNLAALQRKNEHRKAKRAAETPGQREERLAKRRRQEAERNKRRIAARMVPSQENQDEAMTSSSTATEEKTTLQGSNVPSTRPEAASAVDGISTQRRRPYLCKKHTTKSKGTSTSSLTRIRSSASMRSRNTQTEVCAQVDRVTQTARIVIGTATQT